MDSVSQLALGAAIGVAVMGRRTAVWKAALWGGVAGTLPDLDVLWDYGDAVSNMTLHRSHSHSLFNLTLLSPLLAWLASRSVGQLPLFKRWWLAMWLALVTHPLLDNFTIYGTQLLQPFHDEPYGIASMFIIDPLYTVPLLIGLGVALARREFAGLRANQVALAFSCVYLAWSVAAQGYVKAVVRGQLSASGAASPKFFVTPAPLNTVLWRIVVMRDGGYDEGFYSLLDGGRPIQFDRFTSDAALQPLVKDVPAMQRMAWFTDGFYSLREQDGKAILTDLRMGQEPSYVFSFALAQRQSPQFAAIAPVPVGGRGDAGRLLGWLWPRMLGQALPPPR